MTILFFDLDGTLMVNPFGEVIFKIIREDFAQRSGQPEAAIMEMILTTHDDRIAHPLADRPKSMDWDDIFATVAADLGIPFEHDITAMVEAHAAPPHTAVLDDAIPTLQGLRTGRKLVVATMGLSRYQFPVMRALGLYDCFDDFLTPDRTGYLKTDAEFYGDYLQSPQQRIHIGDRPDHDCDYPKQFGAHAILRIPDFDKPQLDPFARVTPWAQAYPQNTPPDAIILHLRELPAVVTTLENQKGSAS